MATHTERLGRLTAGRAKWIVVLACFCILFVVKGTVATYGVFITPIESDFGWSRTTISLTFSIYLVATAVASPITGGLIDRYGASRTFPVFIAFVGVPLAALSAMSNVAHLYLLYAVIGFAVTGLAISHFSSLITKWFESRTLLASGVAISGFSLGQLVFNPVAAEVILTYDWRVAYLGFGLLCLGTIPLAYFLVKSPEEQRPGEQHPGEQHPEEKTTSAEDEESDTNRESDATSDKSPEITVSRALRSRSLWLLVATFFICGFTTVGLITTHFVPYLLSVGFPETIAAQGAGVLGGMTVFGLLAMGAVGDRYASKKRYLLSSIYFLRGVTLLFLVLVASVLDIFVFATVYGFLTLCTVPLHAGITADRFGKGNLTTLVGIQYAGHQLGGATAAIAAGWIFDTMGSYRPAHLVGVGLLLIAPLLVLVDRATRPATTPR